MSALHLPSDVADRLHISERDVMARARTGEFPHVRIGRRVRFTDAHLQQIIADHEVTAKAEPANPWGVRRRRAS